jgi:hypothetical protein
MADFRRFPRIGGAWSQHRRRVAKCQSRLADSSVRKAPKRRFAARSGLARIMQDCFPEIGRTLMQVDLFLVWVALLGVVSFIALSVAD